MAFKRIPLGFYQDHIDRDLPAPPLIKGTLIDTDDPNYDELVDDARHYAGDGLDAAPPGLKQAARALLKALAA